MALGRAGRPGRFLPSGRAGRAKGGAAAPKARPGPGGGPLPPRGAAGTEQAGAGRRPRRSGAPAAAPNKRPRCPEQPPPRHREPARPPRSSSHVMRAPHPQPPLSARLLGIVVSRMAKTHSQATVLQMYYKTQDASRDLLRGPCASGGGLRVVPEKWGRGFNHASDEATNGH